MVNKSLKCSTWMKILDRSKIADLQAWKGPYVCVRARSPLSCLTLCNSMDCSPPGSSIPGILQARILEWVAMPSSRGSSWPRDESTSLTSPALRGEFFTTSATWEAPGRDHRGLLYQYYFLSENNDISGIDRSPEIGHLFSQETALSCIKILFY